MNTTYDQVHFLVVVGLLHLLIFACMRASNLELAQFTPPLGHLDPFKRLTWKWRFEEYLRCLVEAIKRVDQEKQATPKRRANHDTSSGILTLMLSYKH